MVVYNISIPNDLDGYVGLVEYARRRGADINRLMVGVCMENDLLDYMGEQTMETEVDRVKSPVVVRRLGYMWNLDYIKYYLSSNSAVYMASTKLAHQVPFVKALAVNLGFIVENMEGIPYQRFTSKMIEGNAARVERLVGMPGLTDVIVVLIPSRGTVGGRIPGGAAEDP